MMKRRLARIPRRIARGLSCALLLAFLTPEAVSANPAIEAGGLLEWPKEQREPVTLLNFGFEAAWEGWTPAKPEGFTLVNEPGIAHAGRSCLRFDAAKPTSFVPSLRQVLKESGPGVYVLRFWIKAQELGKTGKPGDGVRVQVEWQRQDGQRQWVPTEVFRGTVEWCRKELHVFIPPDLKPGTVALNIHRYGGAGGGEAWVDDFSLERGVPPPVEAFLLYPNYRGWLPDDGPSRVRVQVKVNAARGPTPAWLEVKNGANGQPVARVELGAGTQEQVVEMESGGWPLGDYLVQAHVGDYSYPAYRICKIPGEQRRKMPMWFNEHGVLHQNGRPVFVLGFYNAQGWEPPERLDQLAQAPANCTIDYASWALPLGQQKDYLARLTQRHLSFLSTVNMVYPGNPYNVLRHPIGKELLPGVRETEDTQENLDRYLTRLAAEMRATPGHAGWYVMDERPFDQAAQCFRQYQRLRQVDPEHPTYGVSDKPDELAFWRDTLDVVGLDPYPLFNMKQERPLTLVGDWTRATVEATKGSRPIWMVLQYFQGWSTDRWPTPEELRTMSLMAVTEGARGLFYWSFGVRGLKAVKDQKEQAEYWRRAVAVCEELKKLEPALLAPDASSLVRSVSNAQIRWRARQVENKIFVFAYLPARRHSEGLQAPVEVTFTLRDGRTVVRAFAPDTADWFSR